MDADLDLRSTDALEVPGISKLLRRAVRNLLENARRYSQGAITLELSRQDAMAESAIQSPGGVAVRVV